MAVPAAVINPANPFKSVVGPTWQRTPPPAPIAGQQPMVQPSGPVFETMGARRLGPQRVQPQPFGVPPPAPVMGQRQPAAPTFGGFNGSMGSHFNQRFDEQTGTWRPVTIDATPGDAPSPNANPNMGMLDNNIFPAGQSFEQREANAAPGAFGPPQSPLNRGFASGGNTDPGETVVVGERGPELARGNADGSLSVLPNDLLRGSGGVLEIKPGSPYLGKSANFSTGGDVYDKPANTNPPPAPFSGSVAADAPPPAGTFNPSAPQAPSPADLAAQVRSRMFGTQPTRYDNELSARADLAANAGKPDLPDTSPLTGTPAPSPISVPPAPVAYAAPENGVDQQDQPSVSATPFQPTPPSAVDAAANFRNAANNPPPPGGIANPNLPPPAPQMGQIERSGPNPMDAWNKARNPQREQTAINRFVRHNPLAMPQADIAREATRIKMNEERAKIDNEALQKHAETLRKTAHNVAQESHWDDTIKGRDAVETAKLQETARKEHEKKVGEAADFSDALGQVQTRIGMLDKGDKQYSAKASMLQHILENQKTAKGAAAGVKYYDETFPRAPEETNVGGRKGVIFGKSFHFTPNPPSTKGKTAQSYYE